MSEKLQNISTRSDNDSDLSDFEASSDELDSDDAVEAKKKSYRPRLCPVCHKPKKAKRFLTPSKRATAEHDCKGPCKSFTIYICGREDKHPAEYKKAKEATKY
ncbi:hypothetical protein PPL_03997 [Heterostelium album PN500]|uniref:Uncharacterized protein n=1 Tax=Heterostelium pallidum (strain ATCC 26659 / Pp 5 / PN500) TaxID=670386 RepID=D3B5Q9_HETP5|nr:hypothetical protein PPL_03997 [Heterostelium album PN500]EFA83207.1 hypothetical protein PPL_03997 [Heterostelium album PN500]|eukprot:XP_020435324.1 hypothetical protein PPL_03997 [Heterostelium album PN500]